MILLWTPVGLRFGASAGGLLASQRSSAVLYTPVAAVGHSETEMLEALDRIHSAPGLELRARRQLATLERRILHVLRDREPPGSSSVRRG